MGTITQEKDLEMLQKLSDGNFKKYNPFTKAANVKMADGTTVEDKVKTHLAETAKLIKIKKDITILSANWIDDTATSGFWKCDIADTDITVDTVVDVNIHLADLEKASNLKSANVSSAGKVTIYASEKPAEDIICDLKLVRQVV